MARAISVADIIVRGRRYADMENTAFIGLTEELDLFNAGYSELYDLLVSANENYFANTATIAISSAAQDYDLPDDFYKIQSVSYESSPGQWVSLNPYQESDRNSFGITASLPTGNIQLKFTPFCPIVTGTADLIDGINGFEDYIAWHMAVRMLQKEESSTTVAERQLDRLVKRIDAMAPNRDQGMPHKVVDVYRRNYLQRTPQIRYQLNGSSISLKSTEFITTDFY